MAVLLSWTLSILLATHAFAACTCFKTSAGDIFTTHKLFDFRKGKPANFDSFFSPLSAPDYSGDGSTVSNTMTPSNIRFQPTYMELTTQKRNGVQTSADIESTSPVRYGSFRARYQVIGDSGGVSGFFTYKGDGANEQDIEILTDGPRDRIQYVNHVLDGENASLNASIAADWSEWNTHRFDWTPTASTFYVGKTKVGSLDEGVPTEESTLILNMWSSNAQWGGVMEEGGSASMRVKWIQAFYGLHQSGSGADNERRGIWARGHVKRHVKRQQAVCTEENTCDIG